MIPLRAAGVLIAASSLVLAFPDPGSSQSSEEAVALSESLQEQVRYGWVSGLALLMDVYRPAEANGRGVVLVPGNGWHTGLGYEAAPHTDQARRGWVSTLEALLSAGYTVFVPNVRMAPRFEFPDPVTDLQRAIRYIRYHADRWDLTPGALAAWGGSSGGHLASLVGVLDGTGDPDHSDPVERETAKVQAVVALAGVFDMTDPGSQVAAAMQTSFMGRPPFEAFTDARHAEASPIRHVTPDDPPTLLVHGDADDVVPLRQSTRMEEALRAADVPVRLVTVAGQGHVSLFDASSEVREQTVAWLDRHLSGEVR